jgi:pimeloyl-ACP methyl ester carboxylesterase
MYNGISMIELWGRRRAGLVVLVVLVALAVLAAACSSHSSTPSSTTFTTGTIHRTGALPDGATWELSVPPRWKGTLVLFSHGLVQPGQPNPAHLAADDRIAAALLAAGYALAGSSFRTTGWAVEDALADQTDLLDVFAHEVRAPQRTIAYGASMGGLITTTLLEREPDRFDGGLAVCGVLAGTVPLWNSLLDPMFVLSTLLPDVAAAGPCAACWPAPSRCGTASSTPSSCSPRSSRAWPPPGRWSTCRPGTPRRRRCAPRCNGSTPPRPARPGSRWPPPSPASHP